jgi:hypothetical protein
MGRKRQIYSSHKHFFHLNRKKTASLEEIYSLLEIEKLGHGGSPVDMPFLDEDFRQANLISKNTGGK